MSYSYEETIMDQMNWLGRRAREMWQRHVPWALEEMPASEEYFTELGQTLEAQWKTLAAELAVLPPADDFPGWETPFQAQVAAEQQAEAELMRRVYNAKIAPLLLAAEPNPLGNRAAVMWQENVPWAYAELTHPEVFFARMGNRMSNQIEGLVDELTASQSPDGLLDEMAVRRQAEEVVLSQELHEPVAAMMRNVEHEPIGSLMGNLPSLSMLWESRWDVMNTVVDRLEADWQREADEAAKFGRKPTEPERFFGSTSESWPGGPSELIPAELRWWSEETGFHQKVHEALWLDEEERLVEISKLEVLVRAFENATMTPEQEDEVRRRVEVLREQGLA
jgi:hypothetical protein